jgi:elongation factor 1-beta
MTSSDELNVVVQMRVMPKDVNVDLESIKSELSKIIEEYGKIHKSEIKPIAFGLNALDLTLLLNDEKGGIEEIENKIRNVQDVGGVSVTDVSRL